MKLRHLKMGLGLILAPWAYIAGWIMPGSRLGRVAQRLDPLNLRALHSCGHPDRSQEKVGKFMKLAIISNEVAREYIDDMKAMTAISESQFNQDIFCALTLEGKTGGYFVEVGVGSGRTISNSYMFEKNYGWSGLLVEPNKSSHASISECRSATLDERAAASTSGKKLRFQEIVGMGEHSRIANTGGHNMQEAQILEYDVETIRMTDLLAEVGAPLEIDYLSLDTEGSELDILHGLDLNKYKFKVMTIEHNYNKSVQKQLSSILRPHGYRQVLETASGVDAWFVHESIVSQGCSWCNPAD